MRVAVIGNGMVGQRFLEQLVRQAKDNGQACDITVFCEEPRPAYDRVQLTSYFSGKHDYRPEDLIVHNGDYATKAYGQRNKA